MSKATEAVKAATVKAEAPESEVATDPRADWVYVTIPERDMFDLPHPGCGINRDNYGPGTHLVPKDIAAEIIRICATFDAQNIRILQPRRDMKALTDLYKTRGAGAVDLTPDLNKRV